MLIDKSWLLLIYFLCGGGLVLISVVLGFRMGRQTQGGKSTPKLFNPGPGDIVEKDPYEEAMRSPEEPKRVQTMKGEE